METNRVIARLSGLLVCVLVGAPAWAEKISIAATVNDDVITSIDVNERRDLLIANASMPNTPENRQRITPRVTQMLVDEVLQMQEAKRLSVTIADVDVEKALTNLGAPNAAPGEIKKEILAKNLSLRSLSNQMRAQLAWTKVVQRKLRRNVTISQDDLARAQQAQTANPGTQEIRLAVLAIAVTAVDKEAPAAVMAKEISADLSAGRDLPAVAEKYRSNPNVQYSPTLWVTAERTPPELLALIKDKPAGSTIGPVRSGNIIQFIRVLEQRVTKKPVATTEVLVKQITMNTPPKGDKAMVAKLAQSVQILRDNAGSCDDAVLPTTPIPAKVDFIHTKLGALPPEQAALTTRLDVGQVSDPQLSPGKVALVMLCERTESAGGAVIDDVLKQQLFSEKLELEAQKLLRNLRREATIDIRGEQ